MATDEPHTLPAGQHISLPLVHGARGPLRAPVPACVPDSGQLFLRPVGLRHFVRLRHHGVECLLHCHQPSACVRAHVCTATRETGAAHGSRVPRALPAAQGVAPAVPGGGVLRQDAQGCGAAGDVRRGARHASRLSHARAQRQIPRVAQGPAAADRRPLGVPRLARVVRRVRQRWRPLPGDHDGDGTLPRGRVEPRQAQAHHQRRHLPAGRVRQRGRQGRGAEAALRHRIHAAQHERRQRVRDDQTAHPDERERCSRSVSRREGRCFGQRMELGPKTLLPFRPRDRSLSSPVPHLLRGHTSSLPNTFFIIKLFFCVSTVESSFYPPWIPVLTCRSHHTLNCDKASSILH